MVNLNFLKKHNGNRINRFFFSLFIFIGLTNKELRKATVNRLGKLLPPYEKFIFDEVQFTDEDATCTSSYIMKILKDENLL